MKNKIIIALVCLLLITGCNFNKKENKENKENTNNYNEYKYLSLEFKNQNIIYSPLSINSAFLMLKEGSEGKTYEELNNLFSKTNIKKYENTDKLSIANAVFINNDFKEKIKENYINSLKEKYNAEVKYDSFINADSINNWVSEKTLKLIDKIIDEITEDTKLILVNALGINIEWVNKFECTSTNGSDFTLVDGSNYLATTMHNTYYSNSSYYKDDNIQAVSLDLKQEGNTNLEFIAIMPNNINEYINNINNEEINKVIDKLIKVDFNNRLRLSIPKFKFDYELKLKEDLQSLGIKKVFTTEAELDKIGPNLYVSDALHKANIDFSEDGIKASAVTALIIKASTALEENYVDININKPFIFIIRDKESKDIWFIGTVLKPNSWEEDKEDYDYNKMTF